MKLQPAGQLGIESQEQIRPVEGKDQEFTAPDNPGDDCSGQGGFKTAVGQITYHDRPTRRKDFYIRDGLTHYAAVEYFADDFKFRQFGHAFYIPLSIICQRAVDAQQKDPFFLRIVLNFEQTRRQQWQPPGRLSHSGKPPEDLYSDSNKRKQVFFGMH